MLKSLIKTKNKFLFLFLILGFVANSALAQNRELKIFPIGKIGNALYLDDKYILSLDDSTILDAIYMDSNNIYLIWTEKNGVKKFISSPESKLESPLPNLVILQNAKQKLIALADNQDQIKFYQLPYNSATGFTTDGDKFFAFYHVAKLVPNLNGGDDYQYRFSIIDTSSNKLRTIANIVESPYAIQKLSILSPGNLQLEFSNKQQQKVQY